MAIPTVRADYRSSPVEAFRIDLGSAPWRPPTRVEAIGISVATMLAGAVSLPADRDGVIERAAALARQCRRPDFPPTGCWEDPIGVGGPLPDVRDLASVLGRAGAWHLAANLLESLALLYPPIDADGARVLGSQMQWAIMQGRYDLADARLRALLPVARRIGDEGVLLHIALAAAQIAFNRGNLPRAERSARWARKHSDRLQDARLEASLQFVLSGLRGARGDHSGCLEACWRSYELSDVEAMRAGVLGNLAESLFRTGHFRAARAARTMELRHQQLIAQHMIALGGYAMCSAVLGDERGVWWAIGRAERLAVGRVELNIAQGLLGCADACAVVGFDEKARHLYQRGMALADAAGLHELRFRPDPTRTRPPIPGGQELAKAAEAVRQIVIDLEPDGAPDDLELLVRA